MSGVDELEQRLFELRDERNAVAVTTTKEDLVAKVGEYLSVARSHAAGSSRLALGGRASGVDLEALLAEDLLADEALAARVVKRLEAQGFGAVSAWAQRQQLAKLDDAIAKATGDLREARKREALEEIERQFAPEAA